VGDRGRWGVVRWFAVRVVCSVMGWPCWGGPRFFEGVGGGSGGAWGGGVGVYKLVVGVGLGGVW